MSQLTDLVELLEQAVAVDAQGDSKVISLQGHMRRFLNELNELAEADPELWLELEQGMEEARIWPRRSNDGADPVAGDRGSRGAGARFAPGGATIGISGGEWGVSADVPGSSAFVACPQEALPDDEMLYITEGNPHSGSLAAGIVADD